jgi:hypothetical protein
LDFVVWPQDYKRQVSDDYLIVGKAYLEAGKLEELQTILQAQINKLV